MVFSGGDGGGGGSLESGRSWAGALSAGGGEVELAGATVSVAAAGGAGVAVVSGVDRSIEIVDSTGGRGAEGGDVTGSGEPRSGSVPDRLPGSTVDEGGTPESRIVNAVVVSALVPVSGAVPARGGGFSPGTTIVEVTPLTELSDTISVSICFSR